MAQDKAPRPPRLPWADHDAEDSLWYKDSDGYMKPYSEEDLRWVQDDEGYWHEWDDEKETYILRALCDWNSEEELEEPDLERCHKGKRKGTGKGHDDNHLMTTADDDAAVAERGPDSPDSERLRNDEDQGGEQEHLTFGLAERVAAAVAGGGAEVASSPEPGDFCLDLSPGAADALAKRVKLLVLNLEATLQRLRANGSKDETMRIRAQCVEDELAKERMRVRQLVRESPAIVDAFSRLRRAEDEVMNTNQRAAEQHRAREREAAGAIAHRGAAIPPKHPPPSPPTIWSRLPRPLHASKAAPSAPTPASMPAEGTPAARPTAVAEENPCVLHGPSLQPEPAAAPLAEEVPATPLRRSRSELRRRWANGPKAPPPEALPMPPPMHAGRMPQ